MLAAPIVPPSAAEIATWQLAEIDVRDGGKALSETRDPGSNTGYRRIRGLWQFRADIVKWLLGYVDTYPYSYYMGGGSLITSIQITRLEPQTFPYQPMWVATRIEIEPDGDLIGVDAAEDPNIPVAIFKYAYFDVHYEQVPFDVGADDPGTPSEAYRYLENPAGDPEPSGQYLALPGVAFSSYADPDGPVVIDGGNKVQGTPIPANVGRIIPQMAFKIALRRWPYADVWYDYTQSDPDADPPVWFQRVFGLGEDPDSSVPYLGSVNLTSFLGYDAGTLLFANVRPYRRFSPDGFSWEVDLFLDFIYLPPGHNYTFRYCFNPATPQYNGWYLATTTGAFAATQADYTSIYNLRDFNNLLIIGLVPS